jgi:acetyl-CoA C-acetyltransferase
MSQAPYLLPTARTGMRMGHQKAIDSMVHDGLWDPYNDYHMGNAAELCASEYKCTREMQDEFATQSYAKAMAAQAAGAFKDEIVPVSIPQRKGDPIVVDQDEEPARRGPPRRTALCQQILSCA